MRAQQLGLMTGSLAQATARRIDAQQQWAQVQGAEALSLPEVQSNNAVQDLVSQRAQLQAALQEERQRHTEEYPSVRETAAKIAELDGQIASFASRIKGSFQGRYTAAAQQERQMAGTVAGMRGAAMAERERGVGFNSLGREVETNKAFYDGLLQRYKEVAAAAGAAAANISLVDPAWPPTLADSTVGRDLALAGIGGLLLALVIGGVRERMHNVIRSTEDLEQGVNLLALGCVPRLIGPGQAAALEDPRSGYAEAYHSIAVALQESTAGGLPKTLLITSSTASEGKSTSAWGIARSLSAMGKRVVVVDADLRRAAGASRIGDEAANPGFSDVLAGSTTAGDAVERNEGATFSIVRAGNVTESPVALLSADHMKQALDRPAREARHRDRRRTADHGAGRRRAAGAQRRSGAGGGGGEPDAVAARSTWRFRGFRRANIIGGIITKFDAKSAGVRYGGHDYYTYGRRS